MLAEATERALSFTEKKEMMIVGGVAANKRLAGMLEVACERHGAKLHVCPIRFAGDNGAQISWTAIQQYRATGNGVKIEKSVVRQSWRLDTVDISWRP
jgi:N6-L-threonylcarbamoyladenine synthase